MFVCFWVYLLGFSTGLEKHPKNTKNACKERNEKHLKFMKFTRKKKNAEKQRGKFTKVFTPGTFGKMHQNMSVQGKMHQSNTSITKQKCVCL